MGKYAWLYIPGVLVIMTAAVLVMLRFGYKPSPVVIMDPSYFDQPEEIGAVLYRRFFATIQENHQVVIGIPPQPEFHQGIVRGILKTAAIEQHPFQAAIIEEQMPGFDLSMFPDLVVKKVPTNTDTQSQLIDALHEFEGKQVLILLPSVFSTHLLKFNPILRLEKTLKQNFFTITTGPLALRPDQEYIVDPPCLGSERDTAEIAALGCAELEAGRLNYRKRVKQERFVAIMNEQKPLDYLLMISRPGQDQANNAAITKKIEMNAPAAAQAPGD